VSEDQWSAEPVVDDSAAPRMTDNDVRHRVVLFASRHPSPRHDVIARSSFRLIISSGLLSWSSTPGGRRRPRHEGGPLVETSWRPVGARKKLATITRLDAHDGSYGRSSVIRRHPGEWQTNYSVHGCCLQLRCLVYSSHCNTPFTRWSWLDELALRAHDERSSCARRASSSSQLHRVGLNGV